jgi:ribonuclease VapC
MIVVDTSALMAIALDEPKADACIAAIESQDRLLISAATMAEALIVARHRNVAEEIESLVDKMGFEIVAVTAASAKRVAEAYGRWGKGAHAAALNFGDCFAYEVAKQYDCALLFIGDDFSKTDVASAL